MPRCCVPNCKETGGHQFPRDEKLKKVWLKAIKRVKFDPKSGARVCHKHFKESDYEKIGKYSGLINQRKILKKSAYPSIFPWNVKPASTKTLREERLRIHNYKKKLFQGENSTTHSCSNIQPLEEADDENISLNGDIRITQSTSSNHASEPGKNCTKGTQTSSILRVFTTELLLTDNESVNYYTGLETYAKFNSVLSTLTPMAHDIKFRWARVIGISIKDQFLMLLIKLRRNMPEFEIGKMFGLSKIEVSNVLITWINFVHDIWSLIDIWPSRELVNLYMPASFKNNFPSTSIKLVGTEIPIQKPSHLDAQKVSFSHYKHKNTLKLLVGSSPGEILTYCSGGHAGSISDRQIVEHSEILKRCDTGDSTMADKGLNIQDLFANKHSIGINFPNLLKEKSQIPGVLKLDQKLASQRVHIECLIGQTKTYKILASELNQHYVPIASKIFFICLMLCNFSSQIKHFND